MRVARKLQHLPVELVPVSCPSNEPGVWNHAFTGAAIHVARFVTDYVVQHKSKMTLLKNAPNLYALIGKRIVGDNGPWEQFFDGAPDRFMQEMNSTGFCSLGMVLITPTAEGEHCYVEWIESFLPKRGVAAEMLHLIDYMHGEPVPLDITDALPFWNHYFKEYESLERLLSYYVNNDMVANTNLLIGYDQLVFKKIKREIK